MPTPSHPGSPETVLITGASSGIGRASAIELAGRGARLVLVARAEDPLDDTAREARAAGAGEVLVRPADVVDEAAIRAAVEDAVDRFGRLDAVVHAAQVMAYGRIERPALLTSMSTDACSERIFSTAASIASLSERSAE